MFRIKFLFIALFPIVSFAQNLTGIWQGSVKLPSEDTAKQFSITLYLVQNDGIIGGTSYNFIAESPFYSEKAFEGSFKNGQLDFQETVVLNENPSPDFTWGLAFGPLSYEATDESLSGDWLFSTKKQQANKNDQSQDQFVKARITLFR